MARIAFTLAVAACVVAVAAAAMPVFPNNWSSDQISSIAINQGGIKEPSGAVCCPPDAPECKVQTAFSAGIQYVWFTGNMSAFLGPDNSGVVTDFNAQKQYSVNSSGFCQEYCPLGGQTMAPGIGMPSNAKSMGIVNYNGRQLNMYTITTQIPVLNITMEATNFYIDQSGATAVPVAIIQIMEPFGQKLGGQNQTFVTFTPGVPDKSKFTVKGAASCQQAKGCNGSGGDDDGGNGSSYMFSARRLMAEGREAKPEINIVRDAKFAQPRLEMSF